MGILVNAERELKEIRKIFIPWIYFLLMFAIFFFAFPSGNSLSLQLFKAIKQDLLPDTVRFIVTTPTSAFVAVSWLSVLLSFVVTLPLLLYRTIGYISPALYVVEKRGVAQVIIPSIILFLTGSLFSYYYLLPPTVTFLYGYASDLGAVTYFSIDTFISFVAGLMLAGGTVFLTPVFMILLSRIGLIKSHFWKKNFKYAFLFILIFTAIITPDGSGITMLLLSTPITLLYMAGYGIIAYGERKKGNKIKVASKIN